MANAEAASAAATGGGPRYAPDDPTLPKPWKGLIDGSTGLTYYWNPETNVTQYERPTSAATPLPSGVPPTDTTQSASKPVTQHGQTAEAPQYQQQYMNQASQQQGQFQVPLTGQVAQQQPSQVPQVSTSMQQASQMGAFQQQYAHFGQGMPQRGAQIGQGSMQQGQMLPQMYGLPLVQQSGQQLLPQQGLQMVQQPIQHNSPLVGQQALQHQGPPVAQSQGQSFMPQHMQYVSYQQPMLPQGQQNVRPFSQKIQHGPLFPYQQDDRNGIAQRENSDFPKLKHAVISISQVEQSALAVSQGPPSINASNHALQAGGLSGSFGSSVHIRKPTSNVNLRGNHNDTVHSQQASVYQNQMNQSMMHTQQHGLPATRARMSYDGTPQGSASQENHFNANHDVPIMASQHPKLAAIPMARNQQDMMMSGLPLQNAPPSHDTGLNTVAGHGAHGMYNSGNVDMPISNHTMLRPPPMMPGSADAMNIPSAEAYRQQHEVTATGDNVPAPFMTFEATGFPPEILREVRYLLRWGAYVVRCTALRTLCIQQVIPLKAAQWIFGAFIHITPHIHSAGFSSPTPIQAQTWPIALQNRDIVAIAKTGSGKTLGYLMPAFIHLTHRRNNPRHGPTVLVLAPTRELATQIQDEALKFGRSSRVSCTCLYGGAPKGPQLEELRRGADIVVATPGRLNDILETRNIDLRQVSLLVLDEADRMLDMGFEPQIRKVVNEIPPHRQTLMYTATWPKEVRKIASDLLNNPVQVNIGSVDELAANKSITQFVEVVPQMEKQRRLEQILRSQERGSKVIVFCSTKKLCDELTRSIRRNFAAAAIHGDKSQGERDYVLSQFRAGKSPILVATDVAARGLDIKDIRVVINYDFPTGIEDYVHRIGRTGRAGATGLAYTFLSEQDWKHAADLVKVLEGANQQVPPEVREMALRGGPPFGRDRSDMSRFDSGLAIGSGRWDSGGRGGMRDGGFGGRGGIRDGGFGGRGGMRDRGFGFRGGMRDGGFRGSGFGGRGMRDSPISGRGGRGDFGGRGNRGRGFGGPSGNYASRPRDDYGSNERFNNRDGFGRGRGRGRFDNRRDVAERSRGRSYSSSPEKVRTWGYSRSMSRSRSRSRSWSRSRSHSWSRSRSPHRNCSCSRSPRRSRSRSHSKDRSRGGRGKSRSHDRHERSDRRNWDQKDLPGSGIENYSDIQSYDQKDVTAPGSGDHTEIQTSLMGQGPNGDPAPEEYPGVKLNDRALPASSGVGNQSTAEM